VYVIEPRAAKLIPEAAMPAFLDHVLDRLATDLRSLARTYAAAGRSLAELGSAAEVADRMVASLPAPSGWNAAVGPFYGSVQISKVLGGISRQAVADRRSRHTLLALRTSDGQWVYPTFQFDEHHEVIPGLPAVVQTLAESGVDDWTLAGWLVSPMRSLGGSTPIAWLRSGKDVDTLRTAARDAARRFAQ
jgi:hypothetical protein